MSTVTDKVHEYERVIKGDRRVYKKKEEEESILYHFSNLIFEECVGRKKILLFACIFSTGVKRYTEFKGKIMGEISV